MWRGILGIALLNLLLAPPWLPAQVRLCDWQATDPAPFDGRTSEIQWGSDADLANPGGDFFNMTRFVINRSDQPRTIHWAAGRMLIIALSPGDIACTCDGHLYGRDVDEGPLFAGRDSNGISTRTYVGVQEALDLTTMGRGEPLELLARLAIGRADAANPPKLDVRMTTHVVRDAEGFTITYSLRNASSQAVGLGVPIPDEALRQVQAFPRRILGPDNGIDAHVRTAAEPSTAMLPVSITNSDGILIGIFYATTVVPRGGWR